MKRFANVSYYLWWLSWIVNFKTLYKGHDQSKDVDCASNKPHTILAPSDYLSNRLVPMASISSMNMMQGAFSFAS